MRVETNTQKTVLGPISEEMLSLHLNTFSDRALTPLRRNSIPAFTALSFHAVRCTLPVNCHLQSSRRSCALHNSPTSQMSQRRLTVVREPVGLSI